MRQKIIGLLLCLCCGLVQAQQISIVSVTANGMGRTEALALSDAVVNGVAQVNGESIAASMRMTTSSSSNSTGQEALARNIEEEITRRTKGVVKSWNPVNVAATGVGDFGATVVVNVVVLNRSEQLKRMKLAVVSSQRGDSKLTLDLIDDLAQNLTTSRKFAIMDRRNQAAISDQMGRIRRVGGSLEDQVRLTGELAPDFLAIVTVDALSRGAGRLLATGTLEVIDYSSRQVKFSEKKSFPLKEGDDASNRRRISLLGKGLSRAVIQAVYPPTVIGAEDGFITIGQGSDFFSKGDALVLKKIGAAVRDPHTGEFLSNDQADIGKAQITYVDARIARAKLNEPVNLDPKLLANRKYQVWRTGESNDDFFGDLAGNAAASVGGKGKAKGKIFASDDDDD